MLQTVEIKRNCPPQKIQHCCKVYFFEEYLGSWFYFLKYLVWTLQLKKYLITRKITRPTQEYQMVRLTRSYFHQSQLLSGTVFIVITIRVCGTVLYYIIRDAKQCVCKIHLLQFHVYQFRPLSPELPLTHCESVFHTCNPFSQYPTPYLRYWRKCYCCAHFCSSWPYLPKYMLHSTCHGSLHCYRTYSTILLSLFRELINCQSARDVSQ